MPGRRGAGLRHRRRLPYIHQRLLRQRDSGTAVLIISEDLDEVMSIAGRVLVMYEGRVVGSAEPRTATRESIGLLMAGAVREESRVPGGAERP